MHAKKKLTAAYPAQVIEVTGEIVTSLTDHAYRVCLPNGKLAVAYMLRRADKQLPPLQNGEQVLLTLNPSDFEHARITARLSE